MKTLSEYFYSIVGGSWLNQVVLILSIYVFYSTALQMLRLVEIGNYIQTILSACFCMICLLSIFSFNGFIVSKTNKLSVLIESISLWFFVLIGLIVRIIWLLFFPAEPGSDGAVYLVLADKLRNGGAYEIAQTRAYWPIGYPLYLSGWLLFFNNAKIAYLISNLVLYCIGILGIAELTKTINDQISKLSLLIFAVWPNMIFNNATPEKEMLVLAILPWVTNYLVKGIENKNLWFSFVSGLLLGVVILTQPSLQLLPIMAAILLLIISKNKLIAIKEILIIFIGVTLILGPWTLRNYNEFNKIILVSTNGGDNFYRANNALATGGYTAKGEVDLNELGEIEKDVIGKKLAIEWINSNPVNFIGLLFEKQIRFMGDDSVGVYNTFKVGGASKNTKLYVMFKLFANLWWIFIWCILAALAINAVKQKRTISIYTFVCLWVWLYLFAIHSVFESAGKYHVPIIWVLCVLMAGYVQAGYIDSENRPLKLDNRIIINEIFSQFVRFSIIGGIATVLQYLILILLVQMSHIEVVAASSIGFFISAIFNYFLNYKYTFSSSISHKQTFPRFLLIVIGGLGLNALAIWIGLNVLGMHYILSQIMATLITLLWNFILNRVWTFSYQKTLYIK